MNSIPLAELNKSISALPSQKQSIIIIEQQIKEIENCNQASTKSIDDY